MLIKIKKAMAMLMGLLFLLPSLQWAFEGSLYGQGLNQPLGLTYQAKLLTVPGRYATVVQVHQGGAKTVVAIQDLHCNYEVQRNISGVIDDLVKNHGLQLIMEEGATGTVDTGIIRDFPDQTITSAVSDYFMRQGRLTGADVFASTSGRPVYLKGLEDQRLYDQSLEALKGFLNEETQGIIFDLRDNLDLIKAQIYSPALKKIDQQYEAYRVGQLDFFSYAAFLRKNAAHLGISMQAFPQITKLATVRPKQMAKELDQVELIKEMEALDLQVRQKKYTSAEQAILDQLSRRLDIMEKLINISVSPEELADFRTNRAHYDLKIFINFLKKFHVPMNGLAAPSRPGASSSALPENFDKLDQALAKVAGFYELADERSKAFVDHLEAAMSATGQTLAVMVNGGFHSEKVQVELAKRGISYISVRPNMNDWDVINPYFDILQNRKLPIEQLLEKNQNILAVRNYLQQRAKSPVISGVLGMLGVAGGIDLGPYEAYLNDNQIKTGTAIPRSQARAQGLEIPAGYHLLEGTSADQKILVLVGPRALDKTDGLVSSSSAIPDHWIGAFTPDNYKKAISRQGGFGNALRRWFGQFSSATNPQTTSGEVTGTTITLASLAQQDLDDYSFLNKNSWRYRSFTTMAVAVIELLAFVPDQRVRQGMVAGLEWTANAVFRQAKGGIGLSRLKVEIFRASDVLSSRDHWMMASAAIMAIAAITALNMPILGVWWGLSLSVLMPVAVGFSWLSGLNFESLHMNLKPKQQTTMRWVGALLAFALLMPFLAFVATGAYHFIFAGAWGKALLAASTAGIALQIIGHGGYNTWALARGNRPASIAEDAQMILDVYDARDFVNEKFYTYLKQDQHYLATLLYSLHQDPIPSVDKAVADWLAMPREPKMDLKMGLEQFMAYLEALRKDPTKALAAHRNKLAGQVNDYLNNLYQKIQNLGPQEKPSSENYQASVQFARTIKIIHALVTNNPEVLGTRGLPNTDIYQFMGPKIVLKPETMDSLLNRAQDIMPIVLRSSSPEIKSHYIWIAKQLYDVLMDKKLEQHTAMAVLWYEVTRQTPRIIHDQLQEAMTKIWKGKSEQRPVSQLSPLAQRLLHVLYEWRGKGKNYTSTRAVEIMLGLKALEEIKDPQLYATINDLDYEHLEPVLEWLYDSLTSNVMKRLQQTQTAMAQALNKVAREASEKVYSDQGKQYRLVDSKITEVALNDFAGKGEFNAVTFYLGDPKNEFTRQRLRVYSRKAFDQAIKDKELPSGLKKNVKANRLGLTKVEPFVLVNLDIADVMEKGTYTEPYSGVMEFGDETISVSLSRDNPAVENAFGSWQSDQTVKMHVVLGQVQIELSRNDSKLWLPQEVRLMREGQREDAQPVTTAPAVKPMAAEDIRVLVIRKLKQSPRYFDNRAELQRYLGLNDQNMLSAWSIYEKAKQEVDHLIETYYWPAEWQVHISPDVIMKDKNAMVAAYIDTPNDSAIHRVLIENGWLLAPQLPEREAGVAEATRIIPEQLIAAMRKLKLKPGYPFISETMNKEIRKVRSRLRLDMGASVDKTDRYDLANQFTTSLDLVQRYISYTKQVREQIHGFYTKPASAFRASDVVASTGGGNLVFLKPLLVAFFNWLLSPLKKMGMPGVDAERLYSVFSGAEIYAIAGVVGVYAVFTGDSSVLTGNFLWSMFLGLHAVQSALNWYRSGDAMARYFWPAALISGFGLVFSVNPLTLGVGLHIAVNVVLGFPLVQPGINYLLARNLKTIRMSVKALPGIAEALETATAEPNQSLFENNVIGQALKQALENKDNVRFFRDRNSTYDFQLISGPNEFFRFGPEAQADGRLVMTLHIPQAYRKFLEEEVPTAGHAYNAFLAMTLRWNIERAINHHFRLTQQDVEAVQAEIMQSLWEFGGKVFTKMTNPVLPRETGQMLMNKHYEIKPDQLIGMTASEIMEAIGQAAAALEGVTTLWDKPMMESFQTYLENGALPAASSVLRNLDAAAARAQEGGQFIQAQQLRALHSAVLSAYHSGNAELMQAEISHALACLIQTRNQNQALAALDQAIAVSAEEIQQARAGWVIDETTRQTLQTLVQALAGNAKGVAKQNLDFMAQALAKPTLDGETSAKLLKLIQQLAPQTQANQVALLGDDLGHAVALVSDNTVVEQKITVAGQTMVVSQATLAHAFSLAPANFTVLQSASMDQHVPSVWVAPLDARSMALEVKETGNFENMIARYLQGTNEGQTLFDEQGLMDRQAPIAQAYYEAESAGKSEVSLRALWRTIMRAANMRAHQVDSRAFDKTIYERSLLAMNTLLAKSHYWKTVVMGHLNDVEIVAPSALATGGRLAMTYLWEKRMAAFELVREWAQQFMRLQLRNFRVNSAA